jgi:hypothetical protein
VLRIKARVLFAHSGLGVVWSHHLDLVRLPDERFSHAWGRRRVNLRRYILIVVASQVTGSLAACRRAGCLILWRSPILVSLLQYQPVNCVVVVLSVGRPVPNGPLSLELKGNISIM